MGGPDFVSLMTVVIIFKLRKSPPNYNLLHKRHVFVYIALITNQWCYQYAPESKQDVFVSLVDGDPYAKSEDLESR
jgi:hypothetical protein